MKSDSQRSGNLFRVAIVGAATLKGKELKEVLEERNFPAVDIRLLDDDESLGQLERVQDEVAFVQRVTADALAQVDFTFFASDASFTHTHWKIARDAGSALIDLSYSLELDMNAPVRAPWIEKELGQQPQMTLESNVVAVAHPAAVVLALLGLRAQKAGKVHSMSATVMQPVSEEGRRGMDELHEQTVNLLSFQQMPMAVFDSQVAFNMIGRYGQTSPHTLESVERSIASHVRRLLEGHAPAPSLMLLQAPVFHAHTFSIYIELEKNTSLGDFTQAIAGEHVNITRADEDAPSNVNVAGKDDILVTVRRDMSHENAFWVWAAVDNLRLSAITAVECATALAVVRPHGKVQ
ncbi:MAG TPA: Asd/ArgC dimerization domain-containing protein [Candidatus Angelobacter sp.]